MTFGAALGALASPVGRAVLAGVTIFAALVVWSHWNRADAQRELLQQQGVKNAGTIRKADRAAYSWRECVVSDGVWDFAASRCTDPD